MEGEGGGKESRVEGEGEGGGRKRREEGKEWEGE